MTERGPSRLTIAVRLVITLLANVVAIHLADAMFGGFEVEGTAIVFALLIGVINTVLVQVAVRLAFPIVVYSFGLASIGLTMLSVSLAADALPNVSIESWTATVSVAVFIALVSMVVGWLLALDDDVTFTRAVVRRRLRRRSHVQHSDRPGTVFLEIDGCSYGVLQRAMRAGWMPELASWLGNGHRLERWFTDLSSQTGASQAGLLMGSNEGIVAFRWYDRDRRRVVVTSSPDDALELEETLSTGDGLLVDGGASRNNIVSGDATEASLTLSTLKRKGGATRVWGPYFANPNNVMRTLLSAFGDIARELTWQQRYRRQDVVPRLKKGWKYPFMRVGMCVFMRDLATEMVVADIVRGMPSVYVTYPAYDEVAHHDGVERPAALDQLRRLDRTFGRIRRATRFAPRPYEFVVLSDHGQSQGQTFLQRYGMTLEQLVAELADGGSVAAYTQDLDSTSQLNASLDESRHVAGDGSAVPDHSLDRATFIVLASGSLGLVYLTDAERRMTLEQLRDRVPRLVDGLVAHPGVGWVLVATADGDGLVVGARGSVRVSDGLVDGEDPLAGYGPHALEQVRRHHAFTHLPDVLVMARWDPERAEVPAFEELIGSHGGMGGEQGEPFVLFPAHHEWPEGEDVIGAGELHHLLKRWLRANEGDAATVRSTGDDAEVVTPS
jgi:uncharacterized membrane protein YvlD (DUF360 family)